VIPPGTTDESALIDATVRHTCLPHTYVPLDGLDHTVSLGRLIERHDEPIQFSGVFYQFALREHMAAAGCRAVVVGYGADEIFGGYRDLGVPFLTALVSGGRLRDAARFVFGAPAFLEASRLDIAGEALRYTAGETKASLLRSIKRAAGRGPHQRRPPPPSTWSDDVLAEPGDPEEGNPPPDAPDGAPGGRGRIFFEALLGCFRRNIPLLVRLEDRNAAAHGLELCAPFMDEDVVRAALALPFHRFMDGGRNKAVLRDAARGLLAPEVRAFPRKLATPGSDAHLAFDVLRPELLDIVSSGSFRGSGLWSARCAELYRGDLARRARGTLWFRVYMVHQWYERVVRRRGSLR